MGTPPGRRDRDDTLHSQLVVRTKRAHLPDVHGLLAGPEDPESTDSRFPLRRYARILRDRWRIVATSFVVVTAAVAVGVAITSPVYRAIGTIEIRKQATEVVPVDALFQFERISDQYLQTEYGTLRSRALLERTLSEPRLARRVAQALAGGTSAVDSLATAGLAAARLTDEVHEHLIINPLVGSRIIRVGFDSPDPVLSADVVNALVAHYAAMRQEAGAAALVRLAEQADSVRTRLLEAERALQAYVQAKGLGPVIVAGTDGERVPQERLRHLQQELTEAETEGYRAAALSSAARERESAVESDLLKSLRVRIAELEGEYARARPTFTDSFPRMRQLRSELARLEALVAVEQQRVSGVLSSQHDAAVRRRGLLQAAVDEQRRIMDSFAADLAEYERRHRDVESLKQLYATLQQKRKEASLSAALATMDIAVVDAAAPPLRPLRPRPKRDLALAAVVGLLLGVGLAFIREYSDPTVRTPEEIGGLAAAPLLAAIPRGPRQRTRLLGGAALAQQAIAGDARWHRIDHGAALNSAMAEAFRGLRTSVLFDADGPLPRTLLVTSSSPGEGKTTVSANFAISLAMLGHRVLLVDADLRRPSLHRLFGLPARPGLVEQLEGSEPWRQSMLRDVSPGLDLLPAGRDGISPSDLLSGGALQRWLGEAAAAYDFVILDAPALHITAPDARILSHAAEGVLLVVRSGSTSREVVRRVIAQMPNLVGVILNQLSPKRLPAYYGQYGRAPAHGQVASGSGTHDGSRSSIEGSEATAAIP